jgi:uncharacterized membrane protein YoaK (UPF0700 family)
MPIMQNGPLHNALAMPSVDDSSATKLLPFVLSVIAGSTDAIGFLGLGGLLTAHITGNLLMLVARLVANDPMPLSYLIAVPVFMVVLGMTRLLVAFLEEVGIPSLLPLLLLQFLLLCLFLAVCLSAGSHVDPNTANMIFAGMLGVAAMAVQNALVRISIRGAPSTAVMTTNITAFSIDVGEIWIGKDVKRTALARARSKHTWPAIAGFVIGCALGAACEPAFGLQSLALPTGFALLALVLGLVASQRTAVSQKWVQTATSSPTTRADLNCAIILAFRSRIIATSEAKPIQTDVTDKHG